MYERAKNDCRAGTGIFSFFSTTAVRAKNPQL